MSDPVPPPGSPAAVLQGCECPVLDNRYGYGIPAEHGPLYWCAANCPLHGKQAQPE